MLTQEALIYLDMGWSVYPAHSIDSFSGLCSCGRVDCPCPGKHPVGNWIEYQKRLPTEKEVRGWFGVLNCNIGTVTGLISGIAVVDIDGTVGVESAKSLDLEPTLTARTGSGGYHLFYYTDQPVKTRTKILNGIDIRGDGGYVVLSPSIHKSGNHYEWLEPQPLAVYNPEVFASVIINGDGSRIEGWADELLNGVSEGSRNTSTARLSGRYFNLGLSLGETWVLIKTWNQSNRPPLGEIELRRTVEAVYRRHMEYSEPVRIRNIKQIMKLLEG